MSDYYQTRQEIIKKIDEIRHLVSSNDIPNMIGHLNEIFKAIRDGAKSNDINYTKICFQVILDHIIYIDNKLDLTDGAGGGRLRKSLQDLQADFEVGKF